MIRVRSPAQSGEGACWGKGGGEREIKRERGEHGYEKRKEHMCVQGVFVRLKTKAYVYAGGVFVR